MSAAAPTIEPSAAPALVDRLAGVGVCSTRPSDTSVTQEAGVDTLRLLFETERFEEFDLDGWTVKAMPSIGLTAVEGHPAGRAVLATAAEVASAAESVRAQLHERVGVVRSRGVSRSDQTVTTKFMREGEARAFIQGMAAVDLPRTETTRRGHPPHSVSWTAPNGRRILARCYDKGLERGGEAFEFVRLEDQRRYPSGKRVDVEAVSDPEFLRSRFEARFGPVRKVVDGVTASTFPVVAQALAEEFKYGVRTWQEVERLAGSLVILAGGGARSATDLTPANRRTYYRRKSELRDAGYVVVDDVSEAVSVNLGDVVEQAIGAEWA